VVKTPSNPGFFFGNLLIFPNAPKLGSLTNWKKIFREEFKDSPLVRHLTFVWDSSSEGAGELSELKSESFHVEHSVVLSTQAVHAPPHFNPKILVRKITTDSEWKQAFENQILTRSPEFAEPEYRAFKERQMARYRAMSEQGLGHWFGAFLDHKLVADLGVYRDGTLGRFQSVGTHPDFRRKGICGTLVYQSAEFALREMGLKDLVMIADENYHAAKIYESVGFVPTEKAYSAFWWKRD
jgi:ribosomal protein S18 acetylase RimI-like enzyme